MEIHSWVIGQVIIDIVIAGLLVWFILYHIRMKGRDNRPAEAYRKAEQILSQISELSIQLDKNMEEKIILSGNILKKLDESLRKAEESREQISKIMAGFGTKSTYPLSQISDPKRLRSSIKTLLVKGLTREEIAQNLGLSIAEIELLMKLQPGTDHLNLHKQG